MNVSNAAYSLPLTEYKPGLQKEGIDPLRTADEEKSWYAPIEKVTPRVYHKYAKQSLIENLYGGSEEDGQEDEGEGKTDGDLKDDNQPETPETPTQPENPTTPTEPEAPAENS